VPASQATSSRTAGRHHLGITGRLHRNPQITFLNRGQGWVVRKLREMLPRVRNDRLHADLSEMLRSHEANIALAKNVLAHAS
jgi:Domain of unknown function (DUF6306)